MIYPQAYQQPYQPWQQPAQSVVRVSGIDSARQLRLPPNSSMLALDYDDRHVYAVASDGAGVVAAKAYTLEPCEAQQPQGGFVTEGQFAQFKEEINERLSQLRSGHAGDAAADRGDEPR